MQLTRILTLLPPQTILIDNNVAIHLVGISNEVVGLSIFTPQSISPQKNLGNEATNALRALHNFRTLPAASSEFVSVSVGDSITLACDLRVEIKSVGHQSVELQIASSKGVEINRISSSMQAKRVHDKLIRQHLRLTMHSDQREVLRGDVHLYFDPGNASTETVQELMESLSDLHISAGGLGLEFIVDDQGIHVVEGATA